MIYELHVGTFTPEGTFDAAAARLPRARASSGVTAVELMPVATFPGERGWGYDGVLTFAPHRAYGGPHGLARFVDAAHAAGPRGDPRRRLQPRRPRLRGARARSARTSPTATTRSGATRSTTRSRPCASGRSRTPSMWVARLPHRRPAPRRRARDLRRQRRRTSSPSSPSACARSAPDALVISEMERRRPRGRSRSGATTRSGPTSSTTRCTSC